MAKLDGKVAVVTGGSSGIGLAIAQLFVREGAAVAVLGRSAARLEESRKVLPGHVLAVEGDVSDLDDLDRFFSAVEQEFGGWTSWSRPPPSPSYRHSRARPPSISTAPSTPTSAGPSSRCRRPCISSAEEGRW